MLTRQDNSAGDRLDRDDDFAALHQTRQDTSGPCMERLPVLIVVPVNKNHEGCFAVPGSPIGQLLCGGELARPCGRI